MDEICLEHDKTTGKGMEGTTEKIMNRRGNQCINTSYPMTHET